MNPRFIEEMSWRMGEVYAAVTDQILINLARHFKYIQEGQKPTGSWDYQAKKLAEMGQVTRETEQIIINMLGGYDAELQKLLEASIVDGLKGVEKPLRQAAERGLLLGQGFLPPEVAPNQMQAFKAYYRQSADKLNLVNTVMLDSTRQAYQATVSDIVTRMSATQDILNVATGEVVTGVSSMNQAVRHGVMKMVENGITGFIDHGGHHWSPEAYVTMDVRTTMANTARAAVWERQEQYGNDLYQVSHHDGARPLCYPWQGKVISRDDFSREVEDDEGNTVHVYAQSETSYGEAAGLFGINCGHYPIPFIPGFSRIRPPEQNEEENAKEYEESQKQRALERKVREEKRDLAVLKAQGASDEEIKAQRDKVRQANANLTEFCDKTGRAKRSGRTTTPITADFPEPSNQEETQKRKKKKVFTGGEKENIINSDSDPKPRSLSNEEARKWYLAMDAKIPDQIDRSKPIEDQARQACELRNWYRTRTRDLMADQEARKELDRDHPNKTFEELLADKMARKKLNREDAIKDILKTATKTNSEVNKKLGLKEE